MKVRLLGSGSADGWPNAFCRCASCLTADTMRTPTCALVDDTLLLDCGPETGRQALRFTNGLAGVRHLLVTHDHPDHSAPMALLARSWAARAEPLTVVGPPSVVRSWRAWVGDSRSPTAASTTSEAVAFTPVGPGAELHLSGYLVRVLAANHASQPDAVLYDITAPDSTRLLYATDTGPLPASTQRAMADAAYDVVLLEATFGDRRGPGAPTGTDHLDLDAFAAEVRAARASGAVTDRTDIVAVHLSHHSPPDLVPRLARWGVRVVDDGTELVVEPAATSSMPTVPHPTSALDKPAVRTLVLGGARSGKSMCAERLLQHLPAVTYVAPGPLPCDADAEWQTRVRMHCDRRPPQWTTTETRDVATVLREARQPVLVDCLGTWLTSLLDEAGAWTDRPGWRGCVDEQVDALLEAWHGTTVDIVAVSNEVGAGVVPATASGRLFRDELGRLNTRIAAASECVLLVVAGREIDLSRPPCERQA